MVRAQKASQVALAVKSSPSNAGDLRDKGLTPGSGGSPGEGHGSPLQDPCLENPTYRGAHRVPQSCTYAAGGDVTWLGTGWAVSWMKAEVSVTTCSERLRRCLTPWRLTGSHKRALTRQRSEPSVRAFRGDGSASQKAVENTVQQEKRILDGIWTEMRGGAWGRTCGVPGGRVGEMTPERESVWRLWPFSCRSAGQRDLVDFEQWSYLSGGLEPPPGLRALTGYSLKQEDAGRGAWGKAEQGASQAACVKRGKQIWEGPQAHSVSQSRRGGLQLSGSSQPPTD